MIFLLLLWIVWNQHLDTIKQENTFSLILTKWKLNRTTIELNDIWNKQKRLILIRTQEMDRDIITFCHCFQFIGFHFIID